MNLTNITLSSNVCPKCVEARGKSMTLAAWKASIWGLPGSSGRYCEDDCHCILVPDGKLKDFPDIGKGIKLRGDKDSGIRKIVEIGPGETKLKQYMELWNAKIGRLPKEIYTMQIVDIVPLLEKGLKAKGLI